MPQLMILNPRPQRRRRRAGAKRATHKRRRKMTAKQLRYFGPRRAKKAAAKKSAAPAKVVVVSTNPKRVSTMAKRKRRAARKHHFLSNPKKRRRHSVRRFRRNPRIPGASLFNNAIIPGAIGAAGALGVDLLMASVPLPNAFRSGMLVPVVKIGVALLVGMVVGAVSNREAGEEAAAGGIIVTLYGVARNFMLTKMPNVPLNRYVPLARVPVGQRTMRRYVPLAGRGKMLLRPGGGGLGYPSPARNVLPSRASARFIATR